MWTRIRRKKLKILIFHYAKSYFCKKKIASDLFFYFFVYAFMYLERSVLVNRFQNWKPNWKLSNIERVIDKKLPFLGQLCWYSLKPYICSCNLVVCEIWFSVLKSYHQDASFEIHKIVIKELIFFALAIFFTKA